MKKYLPVALTLVALGTVATTPAYARTIHQPAAQSSRQFYMYAPDAVGSAAAPRSPDFTPYPGGLPVTGTQENRSERDPGYIPGAPD